MMEAQYQDVIGQFPFLNAFSHVVLGFHVDDTVPRESIITGLQKAVDTIALQIPWLAGTVIHENVAPGNSGVFRAAPWPPGKLPNKLLRVKICDDIVLPFQDLVAAWAPISMLDGAVLAPYPGLPQGYQATTSEPPPVACFQANFVKGGLLLTCSAQHNMIDATGMLQLYQLLAVAMTDNKLPQKMVDAALLDRTTAIPLLGPNDPPMSDHSHLKRSSTSLATRATSKANYKWAYFRLHEDDISTLKTRASSGEGYDTAVPFISTNDALSALYWQRIAHIRLLQHSSSLSPQSMSKFGRAIDVRRTMGVPSEYLGHMVYHTSTYLPLSSIATSPLSTIACALRKSLTESNRPHHVRSYATYLSKEPDKSTLLYGGKYNPETDIASSAVTRGGFDGMRFGVLGTPRFFRKPDFGALPGCVYFMPPEEGWVIVLVCLKEDELQALKEDDVWRRWAEWVG